MKSTIRIVLASAVVLVMGLAAWNGAHAEKGTASNSPAALLSNLFKPYSFDVRASSTEVETETPQAAEDNQGQQDDSTSQAGEDYQGQHGDATPKVNSTPEPGDDRQTQHESVGSPEANGEVTGTVTAINATSITVDGVVYNLTSESEVSSSLKVGDAVKLEFVTNADGTVSVREVKSGDASGSSNDSNSSGSDSSNDKPGSGGSDDGSGGHHGGGGGDGGSDG